MQGPGRAVRQPLVPIPVGVDVLQLPVTHKGNRYVVCFVDYLTKWVEAFPMADQKADRILVEQVVADTLRLQTHCFQTEEPTSFPS